MARIKLLITLYNIKEELIELYGIKANDRMIKVITREINKLEQENVISAAA